MIGLPESVKILLFTEPTDMRKGFDGLGALVAMAGEDIYQGHLYVFLSRRRDRAKVMAFQKGGFVLWYKRLERGRFRPIRHGASGRVFIDATELAMLMDGIDVETVRRRKHWQPKNRRQKIDTTHRS